MTRLLLLLSIFSFLFSCSSPEKDKTDSVEENPTTIETQETEPTSTKAKDPKKDIYRLVIRHIDNRAIVYINDSTIYDSQTVYGAIDAELDLTKYVEAGKTDLKVEVYNGKPPYNTASPAWKIVYDIFINDELVEFVREDSRKGDVGLVHTEYHDLSDIW